MKPADIAAQVYACECKYRPALKTASAQFRAECMAVLEGAAIQAAAPYRGMRTALVRKGGKSKRVPVSQVQLSAARSALQQYLKTRNLPTRGKEVGQGAAGDHERRDDGRTLADGCAKTATPLHGDGDGGDFYGNPDGYESGIGTERRTGSSGRKETRKPPGIGEGSWTMGRNPASVVELTGQHFLAPEVRFPHGGGFVVIPRMPWAWQRRANHAWRLLTGLDTELSVRDMLDLRDTLRDARRF